MAKARRLSDNRVLVELIEQGIEAGKQRESAFLELAERFRAAKDPEQVKRLGDELGRMVFKLCGEGQYPKTFLLAGQAAAGQKL